MKKLLLIILLLISQVAQGAESVRTEQATVSLEVASPTKLGLYFKLEPGWHIYWRTPGDVGFAPVLDWTGSENIADTQTSWPAPLRSREKITDDSYAESYYYKDEVLLPITLTPENPVNTTKAKLHINYAICKNVCIPAEADFTIDILPKHNDTKANELINRFAAQTPKENGTNGLTIGEVISDDTNIRVTVNSVSGLDNPEIFIESDETVGFFNPQIEQSGNNAVFTLPITFFSDNKSLSGKNLTITFKNGSHSVEKTTTLSGSKPAQPSQSNIITILLFALLGGLILNIMPCVLPVLSIKLLGIIKHSTSSKKQIASSFIVTSLGILFSFVALALLVTSLRTAGMNVGWGFHFQEPLFIIALVIILTLFAANMWGLFEFRTPQLNNELHKASSENSILGNFLTGILATVLATPCTAPFLGTAVGFAITQSSYVIIATFAAMGLGMATPYLFFSIFPGLVTRLPKPGQWMVTLKKIMGGLIALTALWLIWILSHQLGVIAALILLSLCILKLLLLIKKPIRYGLLIAIIFLAFTVPTRIQNNKPETASNEFWQPFDESKIAGLVVSGKIVFVDVTADWCLTCKVNKLVILDNSEIRSEFERLGIVPMQADWTTKDETIANYLRKHNRAGIPFNIVYGPSAPDGIVLSELLRKEPLIDALEKAR
ncbi:MAG: putative fused thiol:disulfide interchange protein: activator of DsbC [Rickettsiaceae bacterium]|jgi:suppressor for copper-sensitivity B|nr:putative fused thiol:disulfide interchange protein: activator of DsbC [Rickettsiaceae bacterium]